MLADDGIALDAQQYVDDYIMMNAATSASRALKTVLKRGKQALKETKELHYTARFHTQCSPPSMPKSCLRAPRKHWSSAQSALGGGCRCDLGSAGAQYVYVNYLIYATILKRQQPQQPSTPRTWGAARATFLLAGQQ
eukprot:COSAG02_NODE_1990_length_10170_cov_4.723645_2_plen_137_part_00